MYESDLESLTCRVESIDTAEVPDIQDLSIKWFFFNDTEYDLTIGTNPAERTGGNGGHLTVTSTLHISGTSRPNASFVSEGFYYCKVHMFDASVVLHQSQRFQVFHREEYLQRASSCSGRTFSAALESCAVSRLSIDESTTTTTSSVTTATTDEDTTSTDESQSTYSLSTISQNESSGRKVPVWIYILAALASAFVILIIIQVVVCVGVGLKCSKSRTVTKNAERKPLEINHNCMFSCIAWCHLS